MNSTAIDVTQQNDKVLRSMYKRFKTMNLHNALLSQRELALKRQVEAECLKRSLIYAEGTLREEG